MKILFCAPQPFFRIRGTPINVRNMVTALGEAGHQVDLLCYPYGGNLDIKNVKIIRTARFPGIRDVKVGPSLAKVPLDTLMLLKAFSLCCRNHYDVIHAVEESAFFAVWLKKIFRTKFIYDMDSMISEQLRYTGFTSSRPILNLAERLESSAMRNSDFVLTVCDSLTETVKKNAPGTRVVQIEDAPIQSSFQENHEKSHKLREELNLGEALCVVYTGNLENYQGIDMLVRAAAQTLKVEPSARFIIVGGEEKQIEKLRRLTANLDISNTCIFTGKRPIEEMPAFMTLASVLVSPRIKGVNTALKLYTYMQSGKPIVATNLPTHTQVLDDTCAILVLPQIDDLATGLLRALREPLLISNLGKEARKRVASKYSLPSFKNKVRTAYQSLEEMEPVESEPAPG